MINSEEFVERLQGVMEFYNESASSFADEIGVQRSSISHILSGRNKPSLDFVLKVLGSYPEVDLYWLMNGKGTFPYDSKNSSEEKINQVKNSAEVVKKSSNNSSEKEIDRIIIFYKDGSFENFDPK